MKQDIRWKQRYQNLKKSYTNLSKALALKEPDIFQRAGLIHFFSMTFELAWKTMKDFLEDQGFTDINTPRSAIKKAFEVELIQDGKIWLDCLEKRNLMTHVYDEEIASEVETLIKNNYFPIIEQFVNKMDSINADTNY
jgi:nucleotidyltransferase substrate binding protein (TIGR01987 family)